MLSSLLCVSGCRVCGVSCGRTCLCRVCVLLERESVCRSGAHVQGEEIKRPKSRAARNYLLCGYCSNVIVHTQSRVKFGAFDNTSGLAPRGLCAVICGGSSALWSRIFLGSRRVISWLAGLLIPATAFTNRSPPRSLLPHILSLFPSVFPSRLRCSASGQLKPTRLIPLASNPNRCI